MSLPCFVALPTEPAPAKIVLLPSIDDGATSQSAPWKLNEPVHILSGTPNGDHVYCMSTDATREGWLRGVCLETLAVGTIPGLPLRTVLSRAVLARVREDWQAGDSLVELQMGALVQIMSVKGGWAYGWPLDFPDRRGWFPMAQVDLVPSSLSSLLPEGPQELPPAAADSLRELLRSIPQPPRREKAWQGELPAAVKADAEQAERAYHDQLQRMTFAGDGRPPGQEPGGTLFNPGGVAELPPSLEMVELPEDCYQLVVCETAFMPEKVAQNAMLTLEVGDFLRIRASNSLEARMYYGFHVGKPDRCGWIPKSHVELVHDPLSEDAERLPAHGLGPQPPPQIPAWVLQSVAAAS